VELNRIIKKETTTIIATTTTLIMVKKGIITTAIIKIMETIAETVTTKSFMVKMQRI